MPVHYQQVDVFTQTPFRGNPVAVFLHADHWSADEMLRITRWMNLSECTFVVSPTHPDADYRVRIFDPGHEMPFAGHPTLGTAHALMQSGYIPKTPGKLIQECGAGLVPISLLDDGRLFLTLPSPRISPMSSTDFHAIASALGIHLDQLLALKRIDVGPIWATAKLPSAKDVIALSPDMGLLAKVSHDLNIEGVTVYGPHENGDHQIEVRSFAPHVGVPEDPVCGSGNGAVAALIREEGLPFGPEYIATQGRALQRDGRVFVRYVENDILIGGYARTCLSGQLH